MGKEHMVPCNVQVVPERTHSCFSCSLVSVPKDSDAFILEMWMRMPTNSFALRIAMHLANLLIF